VDRVRTLPTRASPSSTFVEPVEKPPLESVYAVTTVRGPQEYSIRTDSGGGAPSSIITLPLMRGIGW
jgi:hypothetical protein